MDFHPEKIESLAGSVQAPKGVSGNNNNQNRLQISDISGDSASKAAGGLSGVAQFISSGIHPTATGASSILSHWSDPKNESQGGPSKKIPGAASQTATHQPADAKPQAATTLPSSEAKFHASGALRTDDGIQTSEELPDGWNFDKPWRVFAESSGLAPANDHAGRGHRLTAHQKASSDGQKRLSDSDGHWGDNAALLRVRRLIEKATGANLSAVRLHTGNEAAQAAEAVSARAFAIGQDIHFGQGQYQPGTADGDRLLAHELVHTIQQRGGSHPGSEQLSVSQPDELAEQEADQIADAALSGTAIRTSPRAVPLQIARKPDEKGSGSLEMGGGRSIQKVGIADDDRGVNLHSGATASSSTKKNLPFNTKLFISKVMPSGMYFVTTLAGDYGYVVPWLVNVNLPEPGAILHKVVDKQSAFAIASKYYGAQAVAGHDGRFYVNVLAHVNRDGIYKDKPDDHWSKTKAKAGFLAWIPSPSFAQSLKGVVNDGSITNGAWARTRDALKAVGDFIVGGAAFVAGILEGVLQSLFDILIGLKDLVKLVLDFMLSSIDELLAGAEAIWNALKQLDIVQLIGSWIADIEKKWNAPDTWARWNFRGWVVGFALAELAMTFLSGGATAAKWVGKATKLVKILERVPGVGAFVKRLKASKNIKKVQQAVQGQAVAKKVSRLFKVSAANRQKILWGTLKTPGTRNIKGGHFRGLLGHPDFVHEITGVSSVNPGCIKVKFIKKLPGGQVSNIKSPASTLFPKGWSQNDIIKSIEEVANNPKNGIFSIIGTKSTTFRGKVKGISIEVIVDQAGSIIAGYPL